MIDLYGTPEFVWSPIRHTLVTCKAAAADAIRDIHLRTANLVLPFGGTSFRQRTDCQCLTRQKNGM